MLDRAVHTPLQDTKGAGPSTFSPRSKRLGLPTAPRPRGDQGEGPSYGCPGAKVGYSDQDGRLSFTTGFRSPFSASSYAAHSTPYAATKPSGRGWLSATSKRFVYAWSPSSSRSKA